MHIHIKCVRISILIYLCTYIYTYTVILSPGLVCRHPSGRIRHKEYRLFGDKEILKQNVMKIGGGGAPRSFTASWVHMDFIFCRLFRYIKKGMFVENENPKTQFHEEWRWWRAEISHGELNSYGFQILCSWASNWSASFKSQKTKPERLWKDRS